jgi:hypothetical protein
LLPELFSLPELFFDLLQVVADGIYRLAHLLVIDAVKDELAFPSRVHQAGLPQNAEVLRGDGLLQLQGIIDLVDVNTSVLIDEGQNAHAQRMGQGAKYLRGSIELIGLDGHLSFCGIPHSSNQDFGYSSISHVIQCQHPNGLPTGSEPFKELTQKLEKCELKKC